MVGPIHSAVGLNLDPGALALVELIEHRLNVQSCINVLAVVLKGYNRTILSLVQGSSYNSPVRDCDKPDLSGNSAADRLNALKALKWYPVQCVFPSFLSYQDTL